MKSTRKDLVVYLISMTVSTFIIYYAVQEMRSGINWKITVFAYDMPDTFYNFLTYSLNPLFFALVWIGMGSLVAFVLHLSLASEE